MVTVIRFIRSAAVVAPPPAPPESESDSEESSSSSSPPPSIRFGNASVQFNAAVLQLGDIGIQLNGAAAFRLGAAACDFRLNGAAGTVRRDTAVTARGAADV